MLARMCPELGHVPPPHQRPLLLPAPCSFAFALGNLTNTVGDVAKAAGAISRAMKTMQTAIGTDSVAAVVAADGASEAASSSSSSTAVSAEGSSSSSSSLNGSGPAAGGADGEGASTSGRPPIAHGYHRQLPIESFRGEIEFRGVSFSHPGWQGWTLDGISFTIPAGKKVALVGPSGG